jgi:hypothetical protein
LKNFVVQEVRSQKNFIVNRGVVELEKKNKEKYKKKYKKK